MTSPHLSNSYKSPHFPVAAAAYSCARQLNPAGAAASSSMSSLAPSDHVFHSGGKSVRNFVKIIQEIAVKYGWNCETASKNWLIRLKGHRVEKLIYGFDIGLNSSATAKFCDDKASTSTALGTIPHIDHQLFLKPTKGVYPQESQHGIWPKIFEYGSAHGFNLVVKPKAESGGKDVFHTKTAQELENAGQQLFEKYSDLCVSPFFEIKHEYRLVMLNGQPQLIIKKIRPHLIGDGVSNLLKLTSDYASLSGKNSLKNFGEMTANLPHDMIPAEGELVYLTWKHNLCNGASAEFIELPDSLTSEPIAPSKKRSHSAAAAEDEVNSEGLSTKKQILDGKVTLSISHKEVHVASNKRDLSDSEADDSSSPPRKKRGIALGAELERIEPKPHKSPSLGPTGSRSTPVNNRSSASPEIPPIRSTSHISFNASDATETPELIKKMIKLARKAANAVGAIFLSVDVALGVDGTLKIMEMNNGVMMEHLIRQHGPEGYRRAKEVYEKAICQLMGVPYRELTLPPRTTRSSPSLLPNNAPKSPPRITLNPGSGSGSKR